MGVSPPECLASTWTVNRGEILPACSPRSQIGGARPAAPGTSPRRADDGHADVRAVPAVPAGPARCRAGPRRGRPRRPRRDRPRRTPCRAGSDAEPRRRRAGTPAGRACRSPACRSSPPPANAAGQPEQRPAWRVVARAAELVSSPDRHRRRRAARRADARHVVEQAQARAEGRLVGRPRTAGGRRRTGSSPQDGHAGRPPGRPAWPRTPSRRRCSARKPRRPGRRSEVDPRPGGAPPAAPCGPRARPPPRRPAATIAARVSTSVSSTSRQHAPGDAVPMGRRATLRAWRAGPRRRASVDSRPRISIDSNSGGEIRWPVTAMRTGPNASLGLRPSPSTSAVRSAASSVGRLPRRQRLERGQGGVQHLRGVVLRAAPARRRPTGSASSARKNGSRASARLGQHVDPLCTSGIDRGEQLRSCVAGRGRPAARRPRCRYGTSRRREVRRSRAGGCGRR